MFDLIYNGSTAKDHGVAVVRRPDIPLPTPRVTSYEIAGRDGALYEEDGTYDDLKIEVEMDFAAYDWPRVMMEVRRWLYSGGDGRLIFSDNPGVFYKVKTASYAGAERAVYTIGKFTVTFVCDPYTYIMAGTREYPAAEVRLNPYGRSMPTYKITGDGRCTLTVNGKTMTAEINQNLTIDTGRMIAYREDGSLMNTSVTGYYEDLALVHGDNEITVPETFGLEVIPNWRVL